MLFFFLIIIYLFILAVLGLRFCARTSSSCGKRGPLFIAVHGPLTIASSLVAEHRLQTHRLSSCGSRAQLLRGMWDLPRPGLEHVSPALAGRFSTTAPPGKPHSMLFDIGLSNIFWYIPSGKGNKNKWMGLCQTRKLLHSEGNDQQNEKAAYWVGEDISKYSVR